MTSYHYFDLSGWRLTEPVDANGDTIGAPVEVLDLSSYDGDRFFRKQADGSIKFTAPVDGATTENTTFARSELRELNEGKLAAWTLAQGGTMTATLTIDKVPTSSETGGGKMVIGQIHGQDDELVRLYYQDNTVYFRNDHGDVNNGQATFLLHDELGETPDISLGEQFSYKIDVLGDKLTVSVNADGQIYSSVTDIHEIWQADTFYFKAGVYLGVNETQGTGDGSATFDAVDFGHAQGTGLAGLAPVDPIFTSSTDGNDVIYGTSAGETLSGGNGRDSLFGEAGDDILDGGTGGDRLSGGLGDDTYRVDNTGDVVTETSGQGRDRIKASVSFTLRPGSEIETLSTNSSSGTSAINLTGNELAQSIYGNAGSNVINGAGGNDKLYGMGGNDTFLFKTALGSSNVDHVADFHNAPGDNDTIQLDDAVFKALTTGALPSDAFYAGTAAHDTSDRIIYDSATGNLFYDADGNTAGGPSQVLFAILDTHASLAGSQTVTAADFFVV